jgi:microcystin-dependent protein
MSQGFYMWSQTAANNASASAGVNWQEGQPPSSVNDSARAMMAETAKYRDDIAGAIATGGTSTAYTVTSYQVFDTLAHLNGAMLAFVPHTTNGATVTLNVDGLGAKPLRSAPNTELLAGVLIQGTPYVATFSNADGAWYLQSYFGNPYAVPLGSSLEFWGTAAPNSSFAFMYGQAISRTTYATLFSMFSTTYGAGDGSTTFNVPDLRGRIPAGKDDMGGSGALRLTTANFGSNPQVLGSVGGGETSTLLTANLPAYTPSGSIGLPVIPFVRSTGNISAGATQYVSDLTPSGNNATLNQSGSFTGTAQGGTSTPLRTVQPTIICNRILRII